MARALGNGGGGKGFFLREFTKLKLHLMLWGFGSAEFDAAKVVLLPTVV